MSMMAMATLVFPVPVAMTTRALRFPLLDVLDYPLSNLNALGTVNYVAVHLDVMRSSPIST